MMRFLGGIALVLVTMVAGGNSVLAATPAAEPVALAPDKKVKVPTWAERLGYPPGKRVVILYAAQMGMCSETNQAGKESLTKGVARSASVMPPCPWFNDFAEWARKHPNADIGISLTMTSDWKPYRWRSVAPRTQVPELVDANGFLPESVLQFALNTTTADVQREVDAQMRRAKEAGIRPTHLAPHMGAMFARPDVMAIYLATAKKYWIPAVLVELTPEQIDNFRKEGVPLDEVTIRLVSEFPLPKLDNLQFPPSAKSYDQKRAKLMKLVQQLKPGITQIVFQPAHESEALKRITNRWQQRVWDAQLLNDPAFRKFLADEGIVLTTWKEMMQRFEGKRAAKESSAAKSETP